MKAKVIIENGETNIILTPENVFETDLIEKVSCKEEKYKLDTEVRAEYSYGAYKNHRINIGIVESDSQSR